MKFITGIYSDIGPRKINEDSLVLHIARTRRERAVLAIVADGIGGLSDGEKASGYLCESISNRFFNQIIPMYEKYKSRDKIIRCLIRTLYDVNSTYNRYALQNDTKLGSTLSCLIILGKSYFIFHLGDTRVYLCKSKEMIKLTDNHTDNQGRLLKCIGSYRFIEPDVITGRIKKNTAFFLASDGYYAHIGSYTTMFDPSDICEEEQIDRRLKELGMVIRKNGQSDNASAIYVLIK